MRLLFGGLEGRGRIVTTKPTHVMADRVYYISVDELHEAARKVHTELGEGLSEAVYQKALAHELRTRGWRVETEVVIPIHYQKAYVGFVRADLVVNECTVVEVKVVANITKAHMDQLTGYMRWLSTDRVLLPPPPEGVKGTVINFGGAAVSSIGAVTEEEAAADVEEHGAAAEVGAKSDAENVQAIINDYAMDEAAVAHGLATKRARVEKLTTVGGRRVMAEALAGVLSSCPGSMNISWSVNDQASLALAWEKALSNDITHEVHDAFESAINRAEGVDE